MFERYDLVIINRSFWPIYPVIGEGLMRLAENLSNSKKVAVILQDQSNSKKHLRQTKRGLGVKFYAAWAFSSSSSIIVKRILDAIFFMFWVLACIIITRPKNIYVSTDPPVIVPFIVAVFSKVMKIKFTYHLQDIHPEATNTVQRLNKYFFIFLKKIDNFTIHQADSLITLNEQMKKEIMSRSNTIKNIEIIENPSITFDESKNLKKKKGFVFTGNLGRPQLVQLLVDSINQYEKEGGTLEFNFAGAGIFSQKILNLSKKNSLVTYLGLVSSAESVSLVNKYEWALLPIEDQITRYAFPSKISSYVCADAKILSICSENTSVANWIKSKKVGITVKPNVKDIVETFFKIEKNIIDKTLFEFNRKELKKIFQMDKFVKNVQKNIF